MSEAGGCRLRGRVVATEPSASGAVDHRITRMARRPARAVRASAGRAVALLLWRGRSRCPTKRGRGCRSSSRLSVRARGALRLGRRRGRVGAWPAGQRVRHGCAGHQSRPGDRRGRRSGGGALPASPLPDERTYQRPVSSTARPGARQPGRRRPEVLVLLGFRDAAQAEAAAPVQEAARAMGEAGLRCRLEVATEDGSRGPAEKVTDLLQRHLRRGDRLAVLRALGDVSGGLAGLLGRARRTKPGSASRRTWPAVWARATAASSPWPTVRYARVCHDGPVFCGQGGLRWLTSPCGSARFGSSTLSSTLGHHGDIRTGRDVRARRA